MGAPVQGHSQRSTAFHISDQPTHNPAISRPLSFGNGMFAVPIRALWEIEMMNLAIRGIDGKIAHGDTHFIDDGATGSAVAVSQNRSN